MLMDLFATSKYMTEYRSLSVTSEDEWQNIKQSHSSSTKRKIRVIWTFYQALKVNTRGAGTH